MSDQPIAELLRIAASQLRDQAERAAHKHHSVLVSPDEVALWADLLVALAAEMDDYGPDEDGHGGPKLFTSRDGTKTVGLEMNAKPEPTDLPPWTVARRIALATLGDDTP